MYHIEAINSLTTVANKKQLLRLRIKNLSSFIWTSAPDPGGINLSWWWNGQHHDSNPRQFLFNQLNPGETVEISCIIETPGTLALHVLNIDLVKESFYWFEQKGANRGKILVSIDRFEETPWKKFQSLCQDFLPFLPDNFPKIDKHAMRKTLLVETRQLPHLEFVIKNTIMKMGEGWGHIIVCATDNEKQIRSICQSISNQIEIWILKTPINSDNDYNKLCLNIKFWQRLNCSKVLIYQSDTIIMRAFDNAFLQYDYIGAAWGPGPHLDKIKDIMGINDDLTQGNGGLSLRSVALMLNALKDKRFWEIFGHLKISSTEQTPEDTYFSLYACRHGLYPKTTQQFSIEPSQGYKTELNKNDSPFGYHKIYNFLEFEDHLRHHFSFGKNDSLYDKINNIKLFKDQDYEIIKNHTSKQKIDVSIIITLFNYEQYISDCIESVLQQTHTSIEIIIVNDNSSDNSLSIVKKYLSHHHPISIINKFCNTGTSHGRNLGITYASGEYIFILDADNTIYPRCIERHFSAIQHTEHVAAYAIVECFIQDGLKQQEYSNRAFNFSDILQDNYIDAMALFHRKTLIDYGLFDLNLLNYGPGYEDWELWLRIGKKGGKVKFINECLSRYLRKPYSLINLTRRHYLDPCKDYILNKYKTTNMDIKNTGTSIGILAMAKSGSTALFKEIRNRMTGEVIEFFEPEHPSLSESTSIQPVLMKLIRYDWSNTDWIKPFRQFNQRIILIRDPRDILISALFFSPQISERKIWKNEETLNALIIRLQLKIQNPRKYSLLKDTFKWDIDQAFIESFNGYDRLLKEIDAGGKAVYYDDLVAGNLDKLWQELNLPLKPLKRDDGRWPHVARTESTNNWRQWFNDKDVELLRPHFDPIFDRFNLFDKSWTLAPSPSLSRKESIDYIIKTVNLRRQKAGLPDWNPIDPLTTTHA